MVAVFCGRCEACVTSEGMRDLRDWISDKMRRRSRRGPNESESTGKSGQELPANQLAPLRPTYPEPLPKRAAESEATPVS